MWAFNLDTNEISYFNSMHSVEKYLEINTGKIKMTCEGLLFVEYFVSCLGHGFTHQ